MRRQRGRFIGVPVEDGEFGDENKIGRLNLRFYGARDVAMNCQEECMGTIERNGFSTGNASPCDFYHEVRKISVTVHVGVFISTWTAKHFK